MEWLDILEAGEHFDTKGHNPQRIYPLSSFKKYQIDTNNKIIP